MEKEIFLSNRWWMSRVVRPVKAYISDINQPKPEKEPFKWKFIT